MRSLSPPQMQGSATRYPWQTIPPLRIAVTLRDGLHPESQLHCQVFASLHQSLHAASCVSFWVNAAPGSIMRITACLRKMRSAFVCRLISSPTREILPRPTVENAGLIQFFPCTAVGAWHRSQDMQTLRKWCERPPFEKGLEATDDLTFA